MLQKNAVGRDLTTNHSDGSHKLKLENDLQENEEVKRELKRNGSRDSTVQN